MNPSLRKRLFQLLRQYKGPEENLPGGITQKNEPFNIFRSGKKKTKISVVREGSAIREGNKRGEGDRWTPRSVFLPPTGLSLNASL